MQPNEKMSDRWSTARPATCSGDMYPAVPTTLPTALPSAASVGASEMSGALSRFSVSLARPKSRTFVNPSAETMMFPGLRSRCTMPAAWALASPSAACARYPRSVRRSVLSSWMRVESVLPLTSSIEM